MYEVISSEAQTTLFRIAMSQPTAMRAEDVAGTETLRWLVEQGYVNCEQFGECGGFVMLLTASIKGLRYCCDHADEIDAEAIGFTPLF